LELTTIRQASKSKHSWQNAIFIAALFVAIPVWAKTHNQGLQQTTQEMASLGTNLQQSARSQGAQAECSTSDFTFEKLRAQSAGYGFTRIMGRITNHCAEADGVQIKIATYNRAGDILSDDDIWPAGSNNIPENSEFPFEWVDTKAVFAKFTVTTISFKSWPARN
jgi:hypothetical protein